MRMLRLPPLARLELLLDYNPVTGIIRWRRGQCAGLEAGWEHYKGYRLVRIDGICYSVARIAFKMKTGREPSGEIDHRNLKKSDNAWGNLRLATRVENCRNKRARRDNSLSLKGVDLHKGKYRATINADGKQRHIGYFNDPKLAAAAYIQAASLLFGTFSPAETNAGGTS